MTINNTFTVTARCLAFRKDQEPDLSSIHSEMIDIDLKFDIQTAEKFLFRFYRNRFTLYNYELIYNINPDTNMITGITLIKQDNIYIIKNINQVINEVVAGYKAIIINTQMSKLSLFDFDKANEIMTNTEEIEEEFNDESIEE